MQSKNTISCLIFLVASIYIGNAQTISSKLVDAKTNKGIPYATIQYGEDLEVRGMEAPDEDDGQD